MYSQWSFVEYAAIVWKFPSLRMIKHLTSNEPWFFFGFKTALSSGSKHLQRLNLLRCLFSYLLPAISPVLRISARRPLGNWYWKVILRNWKTLWRERTPILSGCSLRYLYVPSRVSFGSQWGSSVETLWLFRILRRISQDQKQKSSYIFWQMNSTSSGSNISFRARKARINRATKLFVKTLGILSTFKFQSPHDVAIRFFSVKISLLPYECKKFRKTLIMKWGNKAKALGSSINRTNRVNPITRAVSHKENVLAVGHVASKIRWPRAEWKNRWGMGGKLRLLY